MKIIFDIGHANGTGARGNGYEEHELCAALVKELASMIAPSVEVVVLDYPSLDNKGDLKKTISVANGIEADFGVSFHMDSSSSKASGGHVCYKSIKGKALADAISFYLQKVMPGRAERMRKRNDLAILNQTKAPWVLIELGFITSPDDIKKLRDDENSEINEMTPLLCALKQGIEEAGELAKHWKK